MSLRINHNIAAQRATTSLFQANQRVAGQLGRLGSGLRVPSARFDPAALGIAELMRSRLSSLEVASRNVQDGLGLARTVVDGIGALQEIVHREEELALRALSGTLSVEDRDMLELQHQRNTDEMDRIISELEVSGFSLLASSDTIEIQLGDEAGESLSFDLPGSLLVPMSVGYRQVHLTVESGARWVLDLNDLFSQRLNDIRAEYGAAINRMDSALSSLLTERQSLASSESRIRDADMALETAVLARDLILQQSAASVLAQANVQSDLALGLLQGS